MRGRALALAALLLAPGRAQGQGGVVAIALVSAVEHRVDTGAVVVRSRGWVPGGAVEVRPGAEWRLDLAARRGRLGGSGAENLSEVSGAVVFAPRAWFAVRIDGMSRSFSGTGGRQRWSIAALGGELRLPFAGTSATGVLHLSLPVAVQVTGLPAPGVAARAVVGLQYRWAGIRGSLSYGLERYDFPDRSGHSRREDLSALTFELGFSLRGS